MAEESAEMVTRSNERKPVENGDVAFETVQTIQSGKIQFSGAGSTSSKEITFVKVKQTVDPKELLTELENVWNLEKDKVPLKLVISVTGGALDFPYNNHVREVFRKGIVEAAVSADAWIITGGTNAGVMKYVGKAVGDHYLATGTSITTIGIATWGTLQEHQRYEMEKALKDDKYIARLRTKKTSGNGAILDPNHTHFILVDDGTANYGADVEVRGDLEKAIATRWNIYEHDKANIPMVSIVVEGGPNTIKQAHSSVKHKAPVVIIAGSGRAANVMAEAFTGDENMAIEMLKKITSKNQLVEELKSKLEEMKQTPFLLNTYKENSKLQIDQVILKALVRANKEDRRIQLDLAQSWNRSDIVEYNEILGSRSNTTDWEGYKADEERYKRNVQAALLNNQMGFLKLFLDNNIVRLDTYLTKEVLGELYRKVEVTESSPLSGKIQLDVSNEEILKCVGEVIQDLTLNSFSFFSEDNGENKNEDGDLLPDPMRQLFLFAIVNGYHEMARYFWSEGEEHMAAALTARRMYKEMTKGQNSERKEQLLQLANEYEDLACDILSECENETKDNDTSDLLVRVSPNWGNVSCLKLAEVTNSRKFVSHIAVQSLLNTVWRKGLEVKKSKDPFNKFSCDRLFSRVEPILTPRNIFTLYVVSYMAFLIFFSFVMVSDQLSNPVPLALEIGLYFWGFTLIPEEIREIVESDRKCKRGKWASRLRSVLMELRAKLKGYMSCFWNWIDVLMLSLFFLGFVLRLAEPEKGAARIALACSLFVFYIRFLHNLTLLKDVGPKVLMIFKMFIDLRIMVIILLIVLIGYGVAVQAILYPHVTDPATVFKGIFYRPYFQIYGELFLEDITANPDGGTCTNNATAIRLGAEPCPEHQAWGLVFLVIYMILSNVLLLNMLIAMFSNTFNKVEQDTDLHWKFQYYSLVTEYFNRPVLPPPFIIVVHVYRFVRYLLDKFDIEWNSHRIERKFSSDDNQGLIIKEQRCAYNYIRRMEKEMSQGHQSHASVRRRHNMAMTKVTDFEKFVRDSLEKLLEERLNQSSGGN